MIFERNENYPRVQCEFEITANGEKGIEWTEKLLIEMVGKE